MAPRVVLGSVAAIVVVAACSKTRAPAATKDGAPPTVHVRYVDGGSISDAATVCGETLCREPVEGGPLGESACCLPSLACGVRAPLFGDLCLEPGQPGGIDPACPSVTASNGATAAGCCAPSGRCGLYDRFGPLGCVLVNRSDAGVRCHYDPENTCRALVTVPCDGPEDCPASDVCCGRVSYGAYDAFGCFPSCAVASHGDRGVWDELCHSPSDCRLGRAACVAASGLPSNIGRCTPVSAPDGGAAAGADAAESGSRPAPREAEAGPGVRDASAAALDEGVSCGSTRCEPGVSCCKRDPGDAYCIPRGRACTCEDPRSNDD